MQVAPEPAALLLAGRHDGDARATEVGGETHPTDGNRQRTDELGQHVFVASSQHRAVLPSEHEPTDQLAVLVQLDGSRVRRLWTELSLSAPAVGGRGVADVDGHELETEVALQALGERREQFLAGIRADMLDDAAHALERVVASTPHEPVG